MDKCCCINIYRYELRAIACSVVQNDLLLWWSEVENVERLKQSMKIYKIECSSIFSKSKWFKFVKIKKLNQKSLSSTLKLFLPLKILISFLNCHEIKVKSHRTCAKKTVPNFEPHHSWICSENLIKRWRCGFTKVQT